MFDWLNAQEADEIGTTLADEFASGAGDVHDASIVNSREKLEALLRKADNRVRALRLNVYKKAKFASSFKWRLVENGIPKETADELAQSLVVHLSGRRADPAQVQEPTVAQAEPTSLGRRKQLFDLGNKALARQSYTEAINFFQDLLELDPRHAHALHALGEALNEVGLHRDAEQYLRQSLKISPDFPEAHCTLGIVLRERGEGVESEAWLRRALKLKPNFEGARIHHGITLLSLGRLREARARFEKVLKRNPRNADALFLMGEIARLEGRFDEAGRRFGDALKVNPKMPNVWSALTQTRKMTPSDAGWLTSAREMAESGLAPPDEAMVRFAMGKYCDDINDFDQAFEHFKRGNELLKAASEPYDPEERASFVDDMVGIYTRGALVPLQGGVSTSDVPVFVVGMPRSGTSLMEQIIASHPSAKGVGELGFIDDRLRARGSALRQGLLGEPQRKNLAETYLHALETRSGGATRVVDKAPVNSDYLGPIFSVFPNGRVIYMRRDPIDACLSSYFQNFSLAMNFTMDLSDLAHYFRQHQRLMAHWRSVLPREFILDVPYAELVADQEGWTRKVLAFLDLPWDPRCLDFHRTERQVVTASAWQVRQKIYAQSVARWRNYEKYIGPLLALKD